MLASQQNQAQCARAHVCVCVCVCVCSVSMETSIQQSSRDTWTTISLNCSPRSRMNLISHLVCPHPAPSLANSTVALSKLHWDDLFTCQSPSLDRAPRTQVCVLHVPRTGKEPDSCLKNEGMWESPQGQALGISQDLAQLYAGKGLIGRNWHLAPPAFSPGAHPAAGWERCLGPQGRGGGSRNRVGLRLLALKQGCLPPSCVPEL